MSCLSRTVSSVLAEFLGVLDHLDTEAKAVYLYCIESNYCLSEKA